MRTISLVIIISLLPSPSFGFYRGRGESGFIETLRQVHPNAVIKQISLEEYYEIKRQLKDTGATFSDFSESRSTITGDEKSKEDDREEESDPERESEEKRRLSLSSSNPRLRSSADITRGLGSIDKDAAVVIFVVVAVFFVVVLAVYAGKYLYDFATDKENSYDRWFETDLQLLSIVSDVETGYLAGVEILAGLEQGGTSLGLAMSLGYLNVCLALEEGDEKKELRGKYIIIGPTFRRYLGHDPSPRYFFFSFLSGTTEHKEVGILSIAKFGVSVGSFGGVHYGVSMGSMYLNLKESEGLIRNDNNFNLIGGVEIGYRF